MRPFAGRRVLLVVSGGIAAYKSAVLLRRYREAGAEVDVVLTRGARRFVGRATFEGLAGRAVHTSLWERPLAHLELGRDADVAVVAPATADLLARLVAGRADDLATATLLASPAPLLVCPAMNRRMWEHPATRRNVERLAGDGAILVGPDHGPLAEGETGPGRMAEPRVILAETGRVLGRSPTLAGRRCVVTSGPTRVFLDPVRFLSNPSTGRMGDALAAAAWRRGAETTLLRGPSALPPPHGPRLRAVTSSPEMLAALREELEGASLLLMAAAVTDLRPDARRGTKIRKSEAPLELRLERGPDLLLETERARREAGVVTLGFALETGEEERAEAEARRKLEEKGMDFVALNRADVAGEGFEGRFNRVTLLDRWGGRERFPTLSKREIAERLLDRVEARLGRAHPAPEG